MTGDKQHEATSELNEALAAGFAANNFEALGPFYTEDATLLPPRGKTCEGRAAAAAFWATVARRFGGVSFTTATVKDLGDRARRETGSFTMTGEGQAVEGKYAFVWMLVDGEWQIETAVWNRNAGEGGGRPQGQGQGQGQGQRRAGAGAGQGGGARGGAGGYRAGRPSFQGGPGGGRGPGAGRRGGPGGGQGGGDAGGALYDGTAGLYSNPKG